MIATSNPPPRVRPRRPGRRVHSARTWALLGLGAEAVLLVGLTYWLFPSLWSVLRAVIDIDQSAGSDRGVNLTEVANHPDAMWGRQVTISGRVDEILDPQAILVGSDALFVGDSVLVVGAIPLESLLAKPPGTIAGDDVVRVTGQVRRFDAAGLAAELGGLDASSLHAYDGEAALVAESIEVNPPASIGPGDKEFASMTDGYDVGITVYDIVHRTDDHLGESVTVSGEVEEHLLTPHAFLLGDEALLAVSAEPRPELFVEATAYVTGEVRRFDLSAIEAELGIDLDDERLAEYDGEPVIVVHAVEMVT